MHFGAVLQMADDVILDPRRAPHVQGFPVFRVDEHGAGADQTAGHGRRERQQQRENQRST